MNKEEILKKHCANIHFERPDDTFSNVLEAMNEYADQRISEALNEYKEKLKTKLVQEWHKKNGNDIYDFIDEL